MLRRLALPALVAALTLASPAPAASRDLRLDRVVMLIRHGVRAPLETEAPVLPAMPQAWPRWSTPESQLTPHGAAALRDLATFDRRSWIKAGLLPKTGCPVPGRVSIHTNTASRTIASGRALADGLAPGCALIVDHLPDGRTDALFEPLSAGAAPFDPRAAIASIDRYTGGLDAMTARHRAALAELARIYGCTPVAACDLAARPATLTASPDSKGIDLAGPIREASGAAQVLLLQYAEGMEPSRIGWGRTDAASIKRLGALHAALFDVFTRPDYMAARQAGPLGRQMLAALEAKDGPAIDMLVGHDTNVTALAAILGTTLVAPGYADDDVAPGGAILLERLTHRRTRRHYVRAVYQAPPLDRLRTADDGRGPAVSRQILTIRGCGTLCPLPRFVALIHARIAPASQTGR